MKPSTSKEAGKGAFTLIELLTVIAIIGILAAILIPTVSKVRDSAKNAACKSNLRQLHMGWSLYIEDNGGRAPAGIERFPDQNKTLGWVIYLAPYVGAEGELSKLTNTTTSWWPGRYLDPSNNIFKCPGDQHNHNWGEDYISYAYNTGAFGLAVTAGPRQSLDGLPQSLMVFTDREGTTRNWAVEANWLDNINVPGSGQRNDFRHGTTLNFVQVAGAVRTMSVEEFLNDKAALEHYSRIQN